MALTLTLFKIWLQSTTALNMCLHTTEYTGIPLLCVLVVGGQVLHLVLLLLCSSHKIPMLVITILFWDTV